MTANDGEWAWPSGGTSEAPQPGEREPGGYDPYGAGGYGPGPYGPGGYGSYGPGGYGPYGPPHEYGPYGPWYGGPPPGWRPPNAGEAVAALVLAIVSFVFFPVIPAIIALVLASTARQKIWASGGALRGLTLCRVATILAAVNLVFAAFGIAAAIAAH